MFEVDKVVYNGFIVFPMIWYTLVIIVIGTIMKLMFDWIIGNKVDDKWFICRYLNDRLREEF